MLIFSTVMNFKCYLKPSQEMTELEHMLVKQPSLSQSDYWVRLLVRVIKIEITLLEERFFLASPLACTLSFACLVFEDTRTAM